MEYAMVQVIENRADIDGRVLDVKADPSRPEHRIVTIEITSTAVVKDFPNLFASTIGKRVDVLLPAEFAGEIGVGTSVRCRVRRAGPTTIFAERCSPL
jgi:hypothetical protein